MVRLRRIHDPKPPHDRHPVFTPSRSLMRVIGETTSQSMLARRQWSHREWRWKHRYADLAHDDGSGLGHIDYSVFHHALPIGDEPDAP